MRKIHQQILYYTILSIRKFFDLDCATFFQTLDTTSCRRPDDQWQPRIVQRHVATAPRNRP